LKIILVGALEFGKKSLRTMDIVREFFEDNPRRKNLVVALEFWENSLGTVDIVREFSEDNPARRILVEALESSGRSDKQSRKCIQKLSSYHELVTLHRPLPRQSSHIQ
jgi:hypothetical protein